MGRRNGSLRQAGFTDTAYRPGEQAGRRGGIAAEDPTAGDQRGPRHRCPLHSENPRSRGGADRRAPDEAARELPSRVTAFAQSKVSTVLATSPAFIARKASLMSPRWPRLVTMLSRSSRPWR